MLSRKRVKCENQTRSLAEINETTFIVGLLVDIVFLAKNFEDRQVITIIKTGLTHKNGFGFVLTIVCQLM